MKSSVKEMSHMEKAKYKDVKRAASGKEYAKAPIDHLAVAVAKHADFPMKINRDVQSGMVQSARSIINMELLLKQLKHPVNAAGAPVEIKTRESYQIYNCLKNMPNCIRSMEMTRGDKHGEIGTNRPLENTICVTVHHLDDKSYGGLCVLREWGATDMANIFVGYNPLQNKIWRNMIEDIPDDQFTACILASAPASAEAPSWAEGIYSVVEDFNKFPASRPLPSEAFNKIFNGTDTDRNPSGRPLALLDAQRSICGYNFLQALARGRKNKKRVFVWEDGGYLNPMIDQAIQEDLTIAQFRKKYMAPDDDKTDAELPEKFTEALQDIFVGSVELTRNGYDLSAAIAETRPMNTRLFSIAASYVKIMLEGDSITLACLDALSQALYSTGCSLRNRNVLVMGARGNLGRLSIGHLANMLEDPKKQLWGCDVKLDWPDPQPDSIPKWAEWSACNKPLEHVAGEVSAYDNLSEDIRYSLDVILGWTGGPKTKDGKHYQTITGKNVADWLTKGTKKADLYLVSGSTKTVEFSDVLIWLEQLMNTESEKRSINGIALDSLTAGPIPDQLSIAAVAQMWPDDNPPSEIKRNFGTQFTFVFRQNDTQVTKNVYLVNNTMPVNFMYYGTPTEIMDLTYSQVTSCAAALLRNAKIAPGVYPTDYSIAATKDVYLGKKLDKEYNIPPSI